MTRKERSALIAVYSRLNKITGQVPSNPCDVARLAQLSRICAEWLPRCMNAIYAVCDGDSDVAKEIMTDQQIETSKEVKQ